MLIFMQEQLSVWELLRRTKKPIVLYGMGNGADKILDWCVENSVQVQGVFASDEFVRGQQFRGFTVERYDALRARLGNDLCYRLCQRKTGGAGAFCTASCRAGGGGAASAAF